MPQKYDNFDQRLSIMRRKDKLPFRIQTLINAKLEGVMSVRAKENIFWEEMEKFVTEYETAQPVLPLTLAERIEPILQKFCPIGLDKIDRIG